jgi:hypothetical protein
VSHFSQAYEELWWRGRAALQADGVVVDPLPVDGGMRWGISAVFRVQDWPVALTRCAGDIATLLGPRHFVYGPDAMHITLRQFEGYRADVPLDDANVRSYGQVLFSFASRQSPLAIELRGLAASPTGIVVQGWPVVDLRGIRNDLHDSLEENRAPLLGPEAARIDLRRTAHASLAIFGGPVRDAAALVAFIESHRSTSFGALRVDRVWLVAYRRTRASVELIEYASFPLCGASS